ncbi:MAG: peptide deformylase [Candidatus Parcubacteria bacterium]|nr:MAG: peptide deformylase [Candidatus Parcubacteria bacterium]
MKLIHYPNEILREKTEKVEKIDKEIKDLIKEMKKIMIQNNGVGLAANQIGKNLSIFVAYDKNKFYTFINPEIVKFIGEAKTVEEGCLSLPKIWGQIKRYPGVVVEYQDLFGKKKKLKTRGLLAQIIQHEIDHLNGVLFIDKAIEVYKIADNS